MGFWGVLGRVDDKFRKVADMWVEAVDKCWEVDDKLFLVEN
ncbi:MAG: hypothetical protein ABGX20_07140 [Bacillus sp. (in: firmicutes)]